jgi:hypothetical protein
MHATAAAAAAAPSAHRAMLHGRSVPWHRPAAAASSAPAARLRRGLSTCAMFGFNWPWSKPADGEKKEGAFDSILQAARTAKRGCPVAPKEAPPGLKLATFAGGCVSVCGVF